MRFGTVVTAAIGLLANTVSASTDAEASDDFINQLNEQAIQNLNTTETAKRSCNLFTAGVRKDWTYLSAKERKAYISAVQCLLAKPSKIDPAFAPGARNRYDDFVAVHINQTLTIHGTNLVNITIGQASNSIGSFQTEFQGRFGDAFLGLHTSGHTGIGGEASDVFSSPNEPTFFLHHAMVDRVYWIWQALHLSKANTIAGTITINNSPASRDALKSDILNMGGVLAMDRPISDLLNTLGDSPLDLVGAASCKLIRGDNRLLLPFTSPVVLNMAPMYGISSGLTDWHDSFETGYLLMSDSEADQFYQQAFKLFGAAGSIRGTAVVHLRRGCVALAEYLNAVFPGPDLITPLPEIDTWRG
ncbi:FAD binding domain-containing protein [Ilyonectria robusta]